MQGDRHPNREYFEAYSGQISYLIGQTATLLADDAMVIEVVSPDSDAHITSGLLLPDDIDPLELSTTGRDPQELAESVNGNRMLVANLGFDKLRAMASIKNALDIFDEKTGEGWNDEDILAYIDQVSPGLLNYVHGEYRTRTLAHGENSLIVLESSHVSGLEKYDDGLEYTVTASDEITDNSLTIVLFGGNTEQVIVAVKPKSNPLFERAVSIMGLTAYKKLHIPLTGQFKDEEELDEILGTLYQEFQGRSQEDEIGPLLEEVRSQALAQKDFLTMGHNLTKPTQDDFEDFIELVGSVA